MKKYIVHITIWIIGIIVYYILDILNTGGMIDNISVLLCFCILFYSIYYISFFAKTRKRNYKANKSGVIGGRGFGILVNMFVLEYIFELYNHRMFCICLLFISTIGIGILHKNMKSFWFENEWKSNFMCVFLVLNIFMSSLSGLIGSFYRNILLVEVDYIPIEVKIILVCVYALVFWMSEIPNSIIIKFASKNEDVSEM